MRLYGIKAGVDLEAMLRSVSRGAPSCWSVTNLAQSVLKLKYVTRMFHERMSRDREDGCATGKPSRGAAGLESEAYFFGTSQSELVLLVPSSSWGVCRRKTRERPASGSQRLQFGAKDGWIPGGSGWLVNDAG
jgi:hypothetical protein